MIFFTLLHTGLLSLRKPLIKANTESILLEIEAKNLRTKQTTYANLLVHIIERQKFVKLTLDRENYLAQIVENVPIGSFVFRFSVTSGFCLNYNYSLTGSDANSFYVDEQVIIIIVIGQYFIMSTFNFLFVSILFTPSISILEVNLC